MNYDDFMTAKTVVPLTDGIEDAMVGPMLFPFQRDLVQWALIRGRSAIFADTGLGKTAMQCDWARVVSERVGRVLILAPLAVSSQTVREAAKFGVDVTYLREDDGTTPIVVTNYEMLDRFDPSQFSGVVLDESSILKAYDGRTRTAIIESFQATPYRLACTATPAPNDHTELGNHAEFLGIMTRAEMLSEFFVHDGGSTQSWRLKGHAIDSFWKWVCGWGAVVSSPADMGYDAAAFILPDLDERQIRIELDATDAWSDGMLFAVPEVGLHNQRRARRETLDRRVESIASAIAAEPDESALVWCEYNDESKAIAKAIPGAVEVRGSDSNDVKTDRLIGFAEGRYRVLVTKPSIAGFGMNWQHCARVYFAGPSHSYEQTYQAIRRCWRFGQSRPVVVSTCVAPTEGVVVDNHRRKAKAAETMQREVLRHVVATQFNSGAGPRRMWDTYNPSTIMRIPEWLTTTA